MKRGKTNSVAPNPFGATLLLLARCEPQGKRPTADARPAHRARLRGSRKEHAGPAAASRVFSALLLELQLPQFIELGLEPMPQGALRPQLIQEGLRLFEHVVAAFPLGKELAPTAGNLLFGEQSTPLTERPENQCHLPDAQVRGRRRPWRPRAPSASRRGSRRTSRPLRDTLHLLLSSNLETPRPQPLFPPIDEFCLAPASLVGTGHLPRGFRSSCRGGRRSAGREPPTGRRKPSLRVLRAEILGAELVTIPNPS